MNDSNNISGRRFLWGISLLHLLYFLLACCYRRIVMGDSFEYVYEAVNIRDSLFFYSGNPALPIEPEYMTQRQPLYPLFLMVVYFAGNNWLVIGLQNLLSIINIWYMRKSLFSLGYSSRYDGWLFLLLAAFPVQFIFANTLAPEILLQTFVLLYVHRMILLLRGAERKHALYASLFLIAGLFVKPVMYPFVLVHIIIVAVWMTRSRQKNGSLVLSALLPLAAVLMYNAWNLQRTGKFHFSSNQAFNAVFYYYKYAAARDGTPKARAFLEDERSKMNAIDDYKDRYDYANARGKELLMSNPLPYTAYHLKYSAKLLMDPGKGEMDLFTGKLTYSDYYKKPGQGFTASWKNDGWQGIKRFAANNPSFFIAIVVLLFNLLRLLGFFLFIFRREVPVAVRLFALVLVAYIAVITGPIAAAHYLLPVSLIMTGCAILGMMYWRERSSKLAT